MNRLERDPRYSYGTSDEPILVLLPAELELTVEGLEDLIASFQRELSRMRAAREVSAQ